MPAPKSKAQIMLDSHSQTRAAHCQHILEVCALRRLRQLLILRSSHVPPDLDEHGLHREFALPGTYAWELAEVDLEAGSTSLGLDWYDRATACPSYLSCPRIHTGQIDLTHERHLRRDVRVVRSAVDFEGVYAVLVYALPHSPFNQPRKSSLPGINV